MIFICWSSKLLHEIDWNDVFFEPLLCELQVVSGRLQIVDLSIGGHGNEGVLQSHLDSLIVKVHHVLALDPPCKNWSGYLDSRGSTIVSFKVFLLFLRWLTFETFWWRKYSNKRGQNMEARNFVKQAILDKKPQLYWRLFVHYGHGLSRRGRAQSDRPSE